MQQSHRLVFVTIGAALVLGLGLSALATAQERRDHGAPLHGGKVAMTKAYHFEAVFAKDGMKVYPRTHEDKPLDTSKLSGTATFYHPNSPKPWFSRPLYAAPVTTGQISSSLDLSIGLGTVPPTGAKVAFEIAGLPDLAESTAEFTVPFEFSKSPAESSATHPAPPPGVVTTSPRYLYGPGYAGFGYYQYPGPASAPTPTPSSNPTVYSYGTPRGGYGGSSGRSRDWSTGRDYQGGGLISKPWLRPMD